MSTTRRRYLHNPTSFCDIYIKYVFKNIENLYQTLLKLHIFHTCKNCAIRHTIGASYCVTELYCVCGNGQLEIEILSN